MESATSRSIARPKRYGKVRGGEREAIAALEAEKGRRKKKKGGQAVHGYLHPAGRRRKKSERVRAPGVRTVDRRDPALISNRAWRSRTRVVAPIHDLAVCYPRYSYRRTQIFLVRRSHTMSTNRACRLPDERLSKEWFRNRIDAKIVIEQFRRRYQRGQTSFEPRATNTGQSSNGN